MKTVGTGGDYNNLTLAYSAITTNGLAGNLELQLITGYPAAAETYPITGPASAAVGPYAVTVYPTVSGLSITSTNTTATLSLDGVRNLVYDGRVNKTGSNDLIISNTGTGAYPAIRYINGANNDTIRYCKIFSRNNNTTSGTIVFSTSTGTYGNNNNIIHNCNIYDGAAKPLNCIYSLGTSGKDNTGNIILNNNIYNFFSAGSATNGILISSNNTDWTIDGNRFYQTATITYTSGNLHNAIQINNTSGNNFVVKNNIIGYSASDGTGTYTMTGSSGKFVGINLNVGTTTASSVQNNTITNIQLTTTSGGSAGYGTFCGIYVIAGAVNIGNVTGNTIGGNSTDVIKVIRTSAASTNTGTHGISSTSTSTVNISNNLIAGISDYWTSATVQCAIRGIIVSGTAGNYTIDNNTIGSTTVANCMRAGISGTTTSATFAIGIDNSATGTISITNNTIGNFISNGANTSTLVQGIKTTAGTNTITGNTVRNLTAVHGTGSGASSSVLGISVEASSNNHTVSGNTIFNLSNTRAAATTVNIHGIRYTSSTGTNVISKNFIYGFSCSATSASNIYGITSAGGTATYSNNMISIGTGITGGHVLYGLYDGAGTNNIYYNSVYIGGSPASGASATSAFYSVPTTTRNYKNNIFHNARSNTGSGTGTHYAIYLTSTSNLTINYNDYYANGTGGQIGYLSSARADSVAWKTATSQDANSWFSNPYFRDPANATPDLRIDTTLVTYLDGRGTPISGITDDYFSSSRDASTPDIGADEYLLATPTLTVSAISEAFGNVCTNSTSSYKTFTVSGTNLTSADVTIGALSGYTYCATSGGTYTSTLNITQGGGTLSTQTIYVKLSPTAVQSYNGNIVVGGGGASTSKNVAVTGAGINTAPSVSNGSAGTPTSTACTVSGTITDNGCTSVTAYGIEYSTTNSFGNGTGTAVASSNISGGNYSSNLTGLAASTQYYFHTYATNSAGTTYGAQGTFTTPCSSALPLSEGFEAAGFTNALISNGTNCWTNGGGWYSYSSVDYPSIPSRTGNRSANLYYSSSNWLFHPIDVESGKTYSVQCYAAGTTSTSSLKISYGATAASGDMTNTIVNTTTVGNSGYQLVSGTFTASTTTTVYIGFYAVGGGSTGYFVLDDISVAEVSCAYPTSLTSSNLQQTTATIGWSAASPAPASGYQYYVSTSSTAPVSGTTPSGTVGAGVVTADLTSLSASTLYYFWVRSDCNGSTSTWTGPSTFNTACGAASVPVAEGFESGFSNGTTIAGCYTQESVSGGESWLAGTSAGGYLTPNGGTYAANLWHDNTDWLFINVALTSGVTYNLSLYAKTANNGSIEARYGTTGSAAGMASGSNIISSTSVGTSYAQYSGTFTPGSTGNYYIGIKGTSNPSGTSYLTIDDIAINCVTPTVSAHPSTSSQMICINGTPTDLSVTASPAKAYQWYSNGSASNSGGSSIDGATNSTYTPVTSSAGTLYYYCVVTNGSGCTATSNVSGAIIVNVAGSWMGTTSTDWNTASNWCGGSAPTSGTNVIIPSGTPFSPSIGASGGVCNDITINSGATLTISGSNALAVSGNWSNSGTFTANSSTVTFDGATPTITGATTFYNVTIAGSGAKTITSANFTVNGILSMESTGTLSNAPTYGASATLQYNTASSRTVGVEWITPFAASGGVIIGNTGTITLNQAKVFNSTAPLTINSGSALEMSTYILTLNGDLVNNGGTTSGSGGVTITGTATQNIGAFTTTGAVSMTKTGGTATLTGNVNGAGLIINGVGGTLNLGSGLTHTFTSTWTRTNGTLNGGSSTLKLGAGFSGTGGTFTASTGTVEWNASGAQSMAVVTYNNLTVSGSGAKTGAVTTVNGNLTTSGTATITTGANLSIGGNLTIVDGTTFSAAGYILTVTGTTTVGSGTSGAIAFSSATNSNKTFAGLVTINNGATWTENAAITPFFRNGIVNNGTITASTGVHTFETNDQAISGICTIPRVTVTGITLTNDGTLTIGTALAGSGGLTNAATGTLNINFTGAVGISTLTASTNGNTVNYGYAGTQTVRAITYHHLTLSGTSAKSITGVTVNGDFTISETATATPTTGSTFTVAGTTNFNGGTFSTGATTGYGQTLGGTLTLIESSNIALGSGSHTITFSGSAPAWTAGKTLTITGWSGTGGGSGGASATTGKIQVGVGNLSDGQLAQVSFSGYPTGATITASGELVPSSGAIGATFYSKSSSVPETESNWNTATDGSGMDAVSGDFTRGNIFVVQNGHTMTTAATWSISGTGSKLQITNGGIIESPFAITVAAATTFQIDNGGTYKHQNTGAWATNIFAGTESFGNSSTIEINKTNTNFPTNSTYGNLIINFTTDPGAHMNFAGNLTTINGNLSILNTQNREVRLAAASSPNITISGNLTISGATSKFVFVSGDGDCNVTVNGDVLISDNCTLSLSGGTEGIGTLYVKGNFIHTGGAITETSSGSGLIYINGNSAQTIESIGQTGTITFTIAPTGSGTVEVEAGKTFVDGGATTFNVSNTSSATEFTVNGTFTRTSSNGAWAAVSSMAVSSTGKYISNYSGATIPTATWDAASLLQIDASLASGEFTENFGDVIFNNSAGCTMYTDASAFSQTIQGDLTINSTGNIYLHSLGTQPVSFNVNGNFSMTANGVFEIDNVASSNSLTKKFIVNGNFTQTSGTFKLSSNTSVTITANTRTAELDVYGDFSQTGGTISETATDIDMISRINLVGTSNKTFSTTGQTGQVEVVTNKTGGAGITLSDNSQIDYNLTLTSGLLTLDSYNLTLGSATVIAGTPSATKMIVATSTGQLRKTFTSTDSFTFPIGDNDGTAEYSPVTVNVTGGSGFTTAYIGVNISDSKHPNNNSTSNYLTRYWNVNQAGITACVATVTGTYLNSASDVTGTLSSITAAQLDGTFNQTTNPWKKIGGSVLSGSTLTYTGATITAGQTSVFTGITSENPSISITPTFNPICNGDATTLNTSVSGEGAFVYSWNPDGQTTSNISDSPSENTTYTVTLTDANGITSTADQLITVNTAPSDPLGVSGTITICNGGTTTLTATGGSEGSGVAYEWGTGSVVGDNVIGGETNASFTTPSLSSNQTYWVRRIGNTACTNTTSGVSETVTVVPQPSSPSLTKTPDQLGVCLGLNVSAATGLGSGGISPTDVVEYSTNTGSSWMPYVSGTDILTTNPGADIVVIRARRESSGNGCVNSDYSTAVWSVFELPTLTVNERCLTGSRKIELVGDGGAGSYSAYEKQGSGEQASNVYSMALGSSANFRVKDTNGCFSQFLTYSAPNVPTTISTSGTSGHCLIRGESQWSHVLDGSNNVLVSILDNGNDLGSITANIYVNGGTSTYNNTYYLKRHYHIDVAQQPSTPVTLRLYFTDDEYSQLVTASTTNTNNQDDVASMNDIKVTKYHKEDGTMDNDYSNNDFDCASCFTVLTPVASGTAYGSRYIDLQINSFSELWAHGGADENSWLPVELLAFEPVCEGQNVIITWLTASERNNDYFTIERSIDGVHYAEIARINGSGNSNSLVEYSMIDNYKPESVVYYRLKQTDFNGTETVFNSKAVSCHNVKESTLVVMPNPFKESINIKGLINGQCLVEIFGSIGEKVFSSKIDIQGSTDIQLDFLKPGIYLLHITETTGVVHSFKMVKN